ncbi:Nuclear pore complex protein, partial [Sesamum angolense]
MSDGDGQDDGNEARSPAAAQIRAALLRIWGASLSEGGDGEVAPLCRGDSAFFSRATASLLRRRPFWLAEGDGEVTQSNLAVALCLGRGDGRRPHRRLESLLNPQLGLFPPLNTLLPPFAQGEQKGASNFHKISIFVVHQRRRAMVSPKQLLSVIESTLLARSPPTAAQRIELIHAIRQSLPSFKALLSYPPPKPSDRAQVQSKEVRLRDAGTISLDDQDVQIALKLSEDLHLNEIDCVHLIVSANQEWGLLGREPLEIFRLAAGLWYTERRDLLTAIYTLLRAVVLDQGLDVDLVTDIQSYLEDLISSGLRQRLVFTHKGQYHAVAIWYSYELSREEPRGLGGPSCESYFLDSKGALVERKAVISRERLILGHCLVLSILVERASSKDIKDIFSALKESAAELSGGLDSLKHQITYSLLFSLVIAFISDALSTVPNKAPVLSQDTSFRREFHEIVMVAGNDTVVEGFVDCVRLAWVVHLIMVQDGNDAKETLNSTLSNDMKSVCSCLDVVFANNVFQFWLDKILHTAAYQNDDEDMVYMYNAYLHKQMTCFLSHPLARDKVKEAKEKAMAMLSPYRPAATHNQMIEGSVHPPETYETVREPFVSLLEFVSEIYQKEPELLSGNDVIWTFVKFAGEDHTNFQTLVAFLKMLSTLACNPEGASKVFELLQGKTFRLIGWSTLFECLSIYEDKFKHSLQSPGAVLPEFQEGDAKALVAYLTVLKQVVANGNPIERKNWFPDIEPLFKLLSYENVPPYLKGALRNAIATFVQVSPIMKDTIWRYLEQYDLPVVVGPNVGNSGSATDTQVYDMRFELNEVEARREQYPSTISFINLLNFFIAEERDVSDRGRRFIYDHVFGPFPQRAYADPSEKWQLVVACLKHFQMMLSMYDVGDEDSDAVTDQSHISVMGHSSPIHMQLPVVEVLKRIRNVCLLVFLVPKDARRSVLFCVFIYDRKQSAYPFEGFYEWENLVSEYNGSRMIGLSQLLLRSHSANGLTEDYAACLELRSEECQIIEDSSVDPGVLIMQ